MKTGHPGTFLPSPKTVSRDIELAFDTCQLQVDQLLWVCFDLLNVIISSTSVQDHPGKVHFATDT